MNLRIVHLYPNELGIFGDVGNVTALEMRARWSGSDVSVENVGASDPVPHNADIYVIGSGSTAGVSAVAEVMPSLSRALTRARSAGATLIAIGAGMHLLGSRIEIRRGEHVDGAGLMDTSSELRAERLVGPVVGQLGGHEVAGYVNSGHVLVGSAVPLVEDIHGLPISSDGVSLGGILGTNLHGPFLPMNPRIADDIIEKHTGIVVDLDDPRVSRATEAARRSRDSLRRELAL